VPVEAWLIAASNNSC